MAESLAAQDDPTVELTFNIIGVTGKDLRPVKGNFEKEKLKTKQINLLKLINEKLWSKGVKSTELQMAICGLVEDESLLGSSYGPWNMPFIVPEGDERTLLLVKVGEDMRWWIGINLSTIEKVPFLEAFCSDRWKKAEEIPAIEGVEPSTLNLVDYVFSSGKDFTSTLLTSLPFTTFGVDPSQLIKDLDYLNIACKTDIEDLSNLDKLEVCKKIRGSKDETIGAKQEARQAAETLMFALNTCQLEYDILTNKEKNGVFEAVLFVISHPRSFGQNQRDCMKEAADYLSFTQKQEDLIERWADNCKDSPNGFDSDSGSDYNYNSDDDLYGYYSSD